MLSSLLFHEAELITDMMPPLFTPRLRLQPLQLTDINAISTIIQEPLFIQASHGCQRPNSENQLLRWAISQQKQHQSGDGCCYAIHYTKNNALIGLIILQPKMPHVELSYWLKPSYWRQGIMTEALTCTIREWQKIHSNMTIYACCHADNLASVALLETIGLQRIHSEQENDIWEFIAAG
jgi:ribosomal-protein-alanine N-acetyltransferase